MSLKFIYASLILIFIFIISCCGTKRVVLTCDISQDSQKAINHMQPLINALEKYKTENGKYPQYFNDLVPKYTENVPMIGNEKMTPGSPIFDHLVNEKLGNSTANITDNESKYYIEFTTIDDRICLLGGRNNICEYSSDKPFWNCHQ
jgi:hypothetical protein